MNKSTVLILRWVGYGLLVLALFDFITTLVPLRLQNPFWEFQTLGTLVERVPVPLLGLALVFFGEADFREDEDWEIILLKCLSWLCLLLGLLYLLLIPLGIHNTVRISIYNEQIINTQLDLQMSQVEKIKESLNQETDAKDIEALLVRLNSTPSPDIKTPQQLEEAKSKIPVFVAQAEDKLKKEAEKSRETLRLSLLKNSVKWNLSALVSGVLFLSLWWLSRWARRL
ncbi:MAG TPA: hypothetical protein DCZ55_37170 [Cyanobacteria bacterium UBA11371]|nr:hypothetical protein [Cyanobacteria bacterium UBA11371]HBE33825.1 hypothetical protein [Cyanobacteria bacterium UBA11368]